MAEQTPTRRSLSAAGVLGFGIGGLLDVLVLHLILGLHHLLSGVYPTDTVRGLRMNLLADGLFSVGMVVIAGIGAGLLWRSERRTDDPLSVTPLLGVVVVGVGAFNLVDVLVDHVILDLHQPTAHGGQYNLHWALTSLLIIGAGFLVYRSTRATDTTGGELTERNGERK